MVWSLIVWIVVGVIVAWFTGIVWKHPQGCLMDGSIAILGALAGVIVYGAIAGPDTLLDVSWISLVIGILTAVLALAISRALGKTDSPGEVVETRDPEEAMGVEPEDAPPKPEKPLSEQPPDELGQGELPDDEDMSTEGIKPR